MTLLDKLKDSKKVLTSKHKNVELLVAKGSTFAKLNISLVRYLLAGIFIAIMVLSGYIYILVETESLPDTYAFNKTQVQPLVTQSLPRLSNEAVLRWSSQAVSDIFTFNFAQDIDAHLNRVSKYFTDEGFEQYKVSLNESGLLADLVDKQLVYTANSCDVVSIVNQSQVVIGQSPITIWYMEIPLLLQIQSNSPVKLSRYIANVTIEGGAGVKPDQSIGIAGIRLSYAANPICGAPS